MCPFFSTIILLLIFLVPQFLISSVVSTSWNIKFTPAIKELHMSTIETVDLLITNVTKDDKNIAEFQLKSSDEQLAYVNKRIPISEFSLDGRWNGSFNLHAIFMGNVRIHVDQAHRDNTIERSEQHLPVIITREELLVHKVFNISVAVLVSILYINFGAALDLTKLKKICKKPIGPIIGFFGQFLIMPLLSFCLGLLLFPNSPEMQLGLFFTGASPAGGASNIWTVILGGNMDLSIAMTMISTIASFGMMPFWLFTLGRVIFDKGDIAVPYRNLITYVVGLIIPLALGILINRYCSKIGQFLVRILKILSIFLILFIVIFATVTNMYLFQLFSWQIVVAGLCLPSIAYVLGYSAAKLFKQTSDDALAIALETGIQNTGISIFILRMSLSQPQADLTTIVPVSVAIMTPLPLICLYIGQRIRDLLLRRTNSDNNISTFKLSSNQQIGHNDEKINELNKGPTLTKKYSIPS